MKAGRVGVQLDHRANKQLKAFAHRRRICRKGGDKRCEVLAALPHVALRQCNEDRVLVGEVLVERADRDTGSLRDPIGGRARVAPALKNLSPCPEDGLVGLT